MTELEHIHIREVQVLEDMNTLSIRISLSKRLMTPETT